MRVQTYIRMQMALADGGADRRGRGGRGSQADAEAALCDHTLRKVLSFLELPDLVGSAALVSREWSSASQCKEVWRRRMHKQVLDLFRRGELPGHPGLSPARLFHALYQPNLLANGAFLERSNAVKGPQGAGRRYAWEATHNARGMTWAHPFDFFPELSPLPAEGAGGAKPFSVGCLATGPSHLGWSEMAQVVDLAAALQARGVPAGLAPALLASGLELELSVYVAGGAVAGGEYQVVVMALPADDAAAAEQRQVPLAVLPKLTLPFGHPPSGGRGMDAEVAANLAANGLKGTLVSAKAPLQPTPGEWTRHTARVALPRERPASHVVVALRGAASLRPRGHYATKFAAARLSFVTADRS